MKVAPPPASAVGTLRGEEIKMDLDRTAISHLMRVLTRLYEDPELAVVREYSTNARDSHIEAGQTRPIEVTTPTFDEPQLIIQDFGIGMSIDDLRRTYSQYGASTKRESNDVQGMLGLGSKSALAYTDQFTLEAIRDGVACTVVVYQDAGSPKLKVVDEYTTDQPNGVKVSIPAKPTNQMLVKAKKFFSFWDPDHVLLNGQPPEPFEGIRVSDTFTLVKDQHGSDRVLMGNVAYPTSYLKIKNLKSNVYVVAKVGMGEVSFTPNREALELDETTNKRLIALREQFVEDLDKAAQESIQSAQTPYEAVSGALKWRELVKYHPKIFFKGEEVPSHIKVPSDTRISEVDSEPLSRHKSYDQITPSLWTEAIWVSGFDIQTYNASHKKKSLKWARDKGLNPKHFIYLTGDMVDTTWVDPSRVVTWAELRQIKLPRKISLHKKGSASPGAKRLKGSYDILGPKGWEYEVQAEDLNKRHGRLFYMNPRHIRSSRYEGIRAGYPNCIVVSLGDNRLAKFKRDFPRAECGTQELALQGARKWFSRLRTSELYAMAILNSGYRFRSFVKEVDPYERIVDPRFEKAIRCAKLDVRSKSQQYRRMCWLLDDYDLPEIDEGIMDEYPLLSGNHMKHSLLYINAVWAEKQKQA